MKRLSILSVLILVTLLATASDARAGDTICRGFLTGTFVNIVVPPSGDCFLFNSVVNGNVKALEGSRLFSSNNRIRGNIEGNQPEDVMSFRDVIGGNIQFKDVTPPSPENFFFVTVMYSTLTDGNIEIEKNTSAVVTLMGNRVNKGNIKVEENFTTGAFRIIGNIVAQNLQVFKNRGPAAKTVQSNTVGQDLQCFENDPVFVGSPNFARKAEGQCTN